MRYVKFAIAAGALLVGGAVATAQGATVFYTACDGTGASDTVKVKKVEEDGSGAATVADTTLLGCGAYSPSLRWPSGLAVNDGYAYFSWQSSAGNGIGRVSLTGGAANVEFIAGPASAQALRLNSTVAGGYLYAYVDDSYPSSPPVAAGIVRVPIGGGSFSSVYAAPGSAPYMSFGIAADSLYFASDTTSDSMTLMKSNLDGSGATSAFLGFGAGAHMGVGANASLVTGTSDKQFVYSLDSGQNGYSIIQPVSLFNNFTSYGAVPKSAASVDGQVWSGSYLYFTQADAVTGSNVAIGRVGGDGTGLNRSWLPATSLHQIAIGTMPGSSSSSAGSSGSTGSTPATTPTKTSLNNVINTKAVNRITTWPVSVPCSTTTKVPLASCSVQLLVPNNVLKLAKRTANATKRTVIGSATKKAATGATRVIVKVPVRNKTALAALKAGKTIPATVRMTVIGANGSTGTATKKTVLVAKSWRVAKK